MSSGRIQAVKGTHDILPDEAPRWQRVEDEARRLFDRYGYREVRPPVIEQTELFARGIGQETDIVAKEMYTFEDRDGGSLTLRPEATAGIVRAVIEHNLWNTDPALKVYSLGPMFRRERPQKGRYRQFHQVDVEAFGMERPSIDVEVIEVALEYLRACGLADSELVLNSVGDVNCRPAYVEVLRSALREEASRLCPDCRRRTETNPLRVLDCKVPADQPVIDALPKISEHLCAACRDHFAEVRRELGLLGIPCRISHRLVRGLDYYVRTTFEVTSAGLGAQNSVLGGGRYDGLVEQLGGPALSGIGWALGLERLVMLLPAPAQAGRCEVFLAPLVEGALDPALLAQRALRAAGVRVLVDHEGRGLKSQMKKADRLGARYVAILGPDELAAGRWTVRDMGGSSQEPVSQAGLVEYFKEKLDG
ncbi:MAG TPA: histidine--tRNA ligase [Vicinamibacteria bacterium]|nr:histidine--tRNA ligase [Vicinamibacteria bacterium]